MRNDALCKRERGKTVIGVNEGLLQDLALEGGEDRARAAVIDERGGAAAAAGAVAHRGRRRRGCGVGDGDETGLRLGVVDRSEAGREGDTVGPRSGVGM